MSDKRIPVILDTDIGSDIDDTWALAMMLKSPELDVRLITTDKDNTPARTRIVAKYLDRVGRSDIPLGVGIQSDDAPLNHDSWADDYPLTRYPGTVYEDGVQALCDTIMKAEEPITLICIGPMPNIKEALKRCPSIASKAHFVGMHGSIAKAYRGVDGTTAEWNVLADPAACQAVFRAPWLSKTITPLDTCGVVRLEGERYNAIHTSPDRALADLMANYKIWAGQQENWDWNIESSILYDAVAVYLAFSRDHLEMRTMKLVATDDGYTREDPEGDEIEVAISWEDKERFLDFLTERLLGPTCEG